MVYVPPINDFAPPMPTGFFAEDDVRLTPEERAVLGATASSTPTPTAPTAPVAAADPTPPAIRYCPRCDWPVDVALDAAFTPEDMVRFVDEIMTKGYFTKEVVLFRGAVRLVLRTLFASDDDAVSMAVVKAVQEHGQLNAVDGAKFIQLQSSYAMALAVERLVVGSRVYVATPHTPADPAATYKLLAEYLVAAPIRDAVTFQYKAFDAAVNALARKSLDPSFSRPTGGAG